MEVPFSLFDNISYSHINSYGDPLLPKMQPSLKPESEPGFEANIIMQSC